MNILKKSASPETPQARKIELRALILIAGVLLFGLSSVYQVKTQRPLIFSELASKMSREETNESGQKIKKIPEIFNLKELRKKDDWIPLLTMFEDEADRDFAAEKIVAEINDPKSKIQNVGFLGRIRVTQAEIEKADELDYFDKKLDETIAKAEERKLRKSDPLGKIINSIRNVIRPRDETVRVSVLGSLGAFKNSFIVRTPEEFKTSLIIWSIIFFGAFFGLHIFWRIRKFEGDGLILPPIFLLCGIGFLMMLGFRDPLRDSLAFADFSFGVLLGCVTMAVLTVIDFQSLYYIILGKNRLFTEKILPFLPIGAAVFLSLTLILVGSTPGLSDAKVNLNLGIAVIQPSEIIKILFALFVAFYFAERWEYFRYLEKKKLWGLILFPRRKDILIVSVLVVALLFLFFLQKDLGPALLMAGLFLVLFAIVRQKVGLSILAFAAIILGYIANYYLGISATAADRLEIWRNPWDTKVSGGEQIVHSLWAFASGGWTGTGLGLGDPYFAPAHHTDLILASIGEELGFLGILFIFTIYGFLFYRCYLIAKQSASAFTYFLALGLGVINALQLLFIAGGVLGLIPLSGVVTPFLSLGMSSMICNFAAFGIIAAISSETGVLQTELIKPTKYLNYGFLILSAFIVGWAFYYQVWQSDEIIVRNVLAPAPDEKIEENVIRTKIRRYKYNPRIALAKNQLPFGSIYDRNGVPLASSDWDELTKFSAEYEKSGINLKDVCKKGNRCYPFGNKIFHLIGNYITDTNKDPDKTNQIEIDYENILRGYKNYPKEIPTQAVIKKPVFDENENPLLDPETNEQIFVETDTGIIIKERNYKELLPLIRNRYNPLDISRDVLLSKNRNIKTSIDIGLQLRLTELLKKELTPKKLKGAIVVIEPKTGDLLAAVNFPFPENDASENRRTLFTEGESYQDRSRVGSYPPGSTFKIVTEMAAMRKDANAPNQEFSCIGLKSGRAGNIVRGREIKDDIKDSPHGPITFKEGMRVSCNAYFAQLGENLVGANELFKTSELFGISVAKPNNPAELDKFLPQSAFGQGEIVATPFQIAKTAATVANGGTMQFGRWVTDENNLRNKEAVQVISADQANIIGEAMRLVVTKGTAAKAFLSNPIQIAGKTGTAENGKFVKRKYVSLASHSWFTGFAPYNNPNQRIAFAVLVENGGYGGGPAAKISGEVVKSAKDFGIIQ